MAVEGRHREEVAALTARYEKHLALERSRNDQIQTEWGSRFVQLFKLNPMLVTDIETGMTDPRFRHEPSPQDMMGADAYARFDEEKHRFWEEGVAAGFSDAAIRERWKEVSAEVIEDIG
jgi:hypothetical protein